MIRHNLAQNDQIKHFEWKILTYVGFESDVLTDNIAVIQTEKEFEMNGPVFPVCLPKSSDIFADVVKDACFATGWGKSPTGKTFFD